MQKALVIFSGGQDSTTCLGWAKNRYEVVEAITFFYGQKHKKEIEQSKKICERLGINQKIINVDFLKDIVDSELVKEDGNVNRSHKYHDNLPASFVPNRNALFITLAHAYAQKIGADTIITGVCETDYSGYPDCRNVFIENINESLNLGSEIYIKIKTPLMYLNKSQIWELAKHEGVFELVRTYSLTCYNGIMKENEWGYGCGECPSCLLRKKGYEKMKEEECIK